MAKALVGDNVAVMKVHADTDTRFIAFKGVLAALDRGHATEDKRAHAKEAEIADAASEVDAKGWAVVTTDDGKRMSVPAKDVTVYTQKVVLEHNATMAAAKEAAPLRAERTAKAEAAKAVCAAKGLDVETLTEGNLIKLGELLA